jgi:hypothetical protein
MRHEQVLARREPVFRGFSEIFGSGVDKVELAFGEEGASHEKVKEMEGSGEIVEIGINAEHPALAGFAIQQEVDCENSAHASQFEGVAQLSYHAAGLRRLQHLLRKGTGYWPEGLSVDLLVGSDDSVLAVWVQFEGDGHSGELFTRTGRMGLNYSALFNETAHELSVTAVDSWSCDLQSFMQMISDVVPDAYSHFLVLWLIVNLSGERALFSGVIDFIVR